MTATSTTDTPWGSDGRLERELRAALQATSKDDLKAWAIRSAARLPKTVARRSIRLGSLAWRCVVGIASETKDAANAASNGRFQAHVQARGHAVGSAVHGLAADAAAAAQGVVRLAGRLRTDPAEAAPELLGLTLGLLAGSGGIDGDGGIPDLDLVVGIGAHRSIFTHSIIAGAATEAIIASALELVLLVHAKLPPGHDRRFDQLAWIALRTGLAASIGVDLGLATHLAIDGTIDGMTSYKDLPLPLPIEAHRAILLSNAAAELLFAEEGASKLGGAPLSAPEGSRNGK